MQTKMIGKGKVERKKKNGKVTNHNGWVGYSDYDDDDDDDDDDFDDDDDDDDDDVDDDDDDDDDNGTVLFDDIVTQKN